MGKEIEVKYLVKTLPDALQTIDGIEITQGYLIKKKEVLLRVRNCVSKKYSAGYVTVKGEGLAVRDEYEMNIPAVYAKSLLKNCDNTIEKTRYCIPIGLGFTAELDVFHGELNGLVLVEVEFPCEIEMASFTPPDWFGKNVTHDNRYANARLINDGIPDDYKEPSNMLVINV